MKIAVPVRNSEYPEILLLFNMWTLKLISLLGFVLLLALAWALSTHRKQFPWRTLFWGIGLQVALALFFFKTPIGSRFFLWAQKVALKLNECAMEGAKLVFGPMANSATLEKGFGPGNGFVLAVNLTATIILVSALSSLLYHWKILPRVVEAMAWVMRRGMKSSGSETLSAAANVFLGQTEAPLLVKPYLDKMTRSELMTLMTGGMATIAGGVWAVYVGLGIDAGHLLAASVMSAPAAILVAKIMIPETEKSETANETHLKIESRAQNGIDALCIGAADGVKLTLNVLGMLIAFVAMVALVDLVLLQFQKSAADPITLSVLFGWINAPFAWLMGVPYEDCFKIGQVLGERIVLNEFVGYLSLVQMEGAGELNERSIRIATYALCGFANFGSIAIQIGGVSALAPNRRQDLAALGLKSMIGGLITCYLTATLIGILT